MTYKNIFLTLFGIMFIGFLAILIYARTTSANWKDVKVKIKSLAPNEIDSITIQPSNPDWKINLTLDKLNINEKDKLITLLRILSTMRRGPSTRNAEVHWKAKMTINIRGGEKIKLGISDTSLGLLIQMNNVMGTHFFLCNRLKPFLEDLSGYSQPVGGKK